MLVYIRKVIDFYPVGNFCALFLFLIAPLLGSVAIPSVNHQPAVQSQNVVGDTTGESNEPVEQITEAPSLKAAPINPEEPQSFKLMPHKAVYEIHLHPNPLKKPKDPTISDVTGTGSIEIIKTKEGWVYRQNLAVQIHYHDGTTTTIERNIASWESPTEISFHIENFRDGVTESLLQGGAEATEEGIWSVYFQKPEMDGFITDQPLTFPIMHLEKVLETIKKGNCMKVGCILSNQIVFSYELQAQVRIDTIVIPLKGERFSLKDSSLLPSNKLWRLQEALYELQSNNSVPDYEESNIDIFSTGVISAMETTWGEGITVVLKLKELTVYQ